MKNERGFSSYIFAAAVDLFFLISISVVEARHLPVRAADVLPLVRENRSMRFAPVIGVVDDAKHLGCGHRISLPKAKIWPEWDIQGFTRLDHKLTQQAIALDLARINWKRIPFPEREYRPRADIVRGGFAEIHYAYPHDRLRGGTIKSWIDNLHIRPKIGLYGPPIRTGLNPTKNNSSNRYDPSGNDDVASRFNLFRLICRIVFWLIAVILILIGGHCISIAVLPDNGHGGRYRGRAQLAAWLLVAAALAFVHLGFIVYGTGYL